MLILPPAKDIVLDRILACNRQEVRVSCAPRTSQIRIALLALGCAAAIVVVPACRRRETGPLKKDPAGAARLTQQEADRQFTDAARALTAEEAAELDALVTKNPEDIASTRKLLTFYQLSGQRVMGLDAMVAARRRHLLWLIEHHPESELLADFRIVPSDPTGYAQAKALWLARTAASRTSIAVLSNAANYFQAADRQKAEEILLRLQAIDPDGPTPRVRGNRYYQPWTERLGLLYAQTIRAEPESAYGAGIRKMLDESNDAVLLVAAGSFLVRSANQEKLGFDPIDLGRSYLEHADRLNPSSGGREVLKSSNASERTLRLREVVRAKQLELAGSEITQKLRANERLTTDEQKTITSLEYRAVASMSDADRFAFLPSMADSNYVRAEALAQNHDAAGAADAWSRSQKYAEELLALAPKFNEDPHYGDAIFEGNIVLGLHALRAGDVKGAVRYLREAGRGPSLSEDSQYSPSLEPRLVGYLLNAGERDSVADFLQRAARINAARRPQMLSDAAAIRAGRMPMSYQYMVTPH
jgi:hypothetical protein